VGRAFLSALSAGRHSELHSLAIEGRTRTFGLWVLARFVCPISAPRIYDPVSLSEAPVPEGCLSQQDNVKIIPQFTDNIK
jgi:hypothetical protein